MDKDNAAASSASPSGGGAGGGPGGNNAARQNLWKNKGKDAEVSKQLHFMHHFILLALSFLVLIRAKNPLKSVNALS